MKIKIIKKHPNINAKVGTEMELPENTANRLIAGEYAVEAGSEPTEPVDGGDAKPAKAPKAKK